MELDKTPLKEGFRFPAEWEKHESTWLTYPKQNESWPKNFKEACDEYNQFVKIISKGEKVNIITDSVIHTNRIKDALSKIEAEINNLNFYEFESDDCWCRDHGTEFLVNSITKEKAIVKWDFNAWGEKYDFTKDNEIGNKISELLNIRTFHPQIIMEGGSIEVNGSGSLITTRSCLLNKNRNPNLSVTEIESYLKEFYSVSNIIWLEQGIEGDDTDGHVDDITRFTDNKKILTAIEGNKKSPNYDILKKNIKILEKSMLENNSSPEITELPTPGKLKTNGVVLPASYANFYISNYAIIVPVFGSKNDDKAIEIISSCFPQKKVLGLYSRNIIYGLGSWHCLSKQEAAIK